ncbi:MAG: L,D-transpeptidase family protein [Sulfurovaceae bacterium]|nr:L,D-transpeptidase family protein [Sulfurovaceae bacterium]
MKSYKIAFTLLLWTTYSFAGKEIIIDLSAQKIYAIEDGQVVMDSRISTGKPGYRTPAGNFKVLEKQVHHISNIYNLPMPFMLRVTNYGVAIHQGYVPDYPASHGCIRVPRENAQKIFDWAEVGTPIHIEYTANNIPSYSADANTANTTNKQSQLGNNQNGIQSKRVTIDDFL